MYIESFTTVGVIQFSQNSPASPSVLHTNTISALASYGCPEKQVRKKILKQIVLSSMFVTYKNRWERFC